MHALFRGVVFFSCALMSFRDCPGHQAVPDHTAGNITTPSPTLLNPEA